MEAGRYFGLEKTYLQALMTATIVYTKRLFTLTADKDAALTEALREELAA